MALSEDLLKEARDLAAKGKTRPRQASLRRAVSTAYYALFHLLTEDASHMAVRGKLLRPLVRRAFQHAAMAEASKSFKGGNLPQHLKPVLAAPLSKHLREVAGTFVELQQVRHEADYDVVRRFSRSEVDHLLGRTEAAFRAWRSNIPRAEAEAYMASLLLWKQWAR